jgi:hypothetical protein
MCRSRWLLLVGIVGLLLAGAMAGQAGEPGSKEPTEQDEAVRKWTALLKHRDWYERQRAARELANIGPPAKEAVPELIAALKDPKDWVRVWSAEALGKIGPDARKAAPDLIGALRDPERMVQQAAVTALAKVGPADKETVPSLAKLLKDPKASVREAAVQALQMGALAEDAADDLAAAAAKDDDANVRRSALAALQSMGLTLGPGGTAVRPPPPPVRPLLAASAAQPAAEPRKPAAEPIVEPPWAEQYFHAGRLADGERALAAQLDRDPKDDQARFGLGALQFLRAVEHLAQSLYRYGVRSDRGRQMNIPLLRLPVPINPRPEKLTYPAVCQILQDWVADLQKAEATLAGIKDDGVRFPLRVGRVRLDLLGDGKPHDPLIGLVTQYMGGGRNLLPDPDLPVVFDRGDVAWLRAYCHLLMALGETALAHDGQELFDCTAHLFFTNVETPYQFLTEPEQAIGWWGIPDGVNVLDLIALVHLIRLPVKEPDRLKAALGHLEKMLALSKESWKYILAETDDDHEWIPNPRQTGALGVRVSKEMVDSWLAFLDEAEELLAGKRLVPFWRGREERGVNLRRVFTEPRTFDLVLWVQGTAATPYLERGPLTRPEVWARLQRVFGGEFIGFALWFN